MVSKVVFSIAVLLYAVGFATAWIANRRCGRQEDCTLDECCSKRFMVNESYCVPYRREGEICMGGPLGDQLFDGVYDINCPCAPGLFCVQNDYKQKNGAFAATGNPRCKDPKKRAYATVSSSSSSSSSSGSAVASRNAYGSSTGYGNAVPYSNAGGYPNSGYASSNSYAGGYSNRRAYPYNSIPRVYVPAY